MTSQLIELTGQTGVNLSYYPPQGVRWRILGVGLKLVADATSGSRSVRASLQRGSAGFGSELADTGTVSTVSTTYYATGDVAGDTSPILANTRSVQWGSHPEIAYPDTLEITSVLISGDTYDIHITFEVLDD